MKNNKKGISAIVATVLIILITVAAVTIIWAAIIPMISNQLESGTVCLDAVSAVQLKDEGYTCKNMTLSAANSKCLVSVDGAVSTVSGCDAAGGEDFCILAGNDCAGDGTGSAPGTWSPQYDISFHVGRTAKDFDLKALQILVSVGGDTFTEEQDVTLAANGASVFMVNGSNFDKATKIQIAPIVGVGATREACDVSATKTLTAC